MSTRKELKFVVFLIHILAAACGKSPSEAYSICKCSGALHDYLIPHYEVLHSLGANALIEDLTEYVRDTNIRPRTKDDTGYISFPKAAGFFWDHEGWGVRWKLTKESGQEREYNLTIDLEETDDEHKTFHYTVKYSDLCYAVGKAITEALKKHGFGGFHTSVWESDVNVRHLCFLKSCGMGMPDAVIPFDSAEKGVGAVSSFTDEIELLLFDM